jgi:hypothetical protein
VFLPPSLSFRFLLTPSDSSRPLQRIFRGSARGSCTRSMTAPLRRGLRGWRSPEAWVRGVRGCRSLQSAPFRGILRVQRCFHQFYDFALCSRSRLAVLLSGVCCLLSKLPLRRQLTHHASHRRGRSLGNAAGPQAVTMTRISWSSRPLLQRRHRM